MHVRAAALLLAVVVACCAATATAAPPAQPPAYKDASLPVQQRVDDLLSRMTHRGEGRPDGPDQRLGADGRPGQPVGPRAVQPRRAGRRAQRQPDRLDPLRRRRVAAGRQRRPRVGDDGQRHPALRARGVADNRLGIPIIYGVDAVHGHNNLSDATMPPHQIGLGATFDPALARRLGESTARAVRATGIHWDFAPVLDTQRDHRWGRSYEPFSRTRCSTARSAPPRSRACEGNDIASPRSVAATAKHFLGYSAPDNGHDRTDATISEQELRDIHLPPFAQGDRRGRRDRDDQQRLGQRRARPRLPPSADRRAARRAGLPGRRDLRLERRREPVEEVRRRGRHEGGADAGRQRRDGHVDDPAQRRRVHREHARRRRRRVDHGGAHRRGRRADPDAEVPPRHLRAPLRRPRHRRAGRRGPGQPRRSPARPRARASCCSRTTGRCR